MGFAVVGGNALYGNAVSVGTTCVQSSKRLHARLAEAEPGAVAANNPRAGVQIAGTGGARELRVAGRGRGKGGGYRVITFYSGEDVPVFLPTLYSKGKRRT